MVIIIIIIIIIITIISLFGKCTRYDLAYEAGLQALHSNT